MSPLWRDQLRIVLCPDKVIIVRLGRGMRPAIVSKHIIDCVPVVGAPPWGAPLDALSRWLTEVKPSKADVVVILSNHFVRYSTLPWAPSVNNASEEQAYARIHFEKIYGDVAALWAVKISGAAYGAPRLASAVDRDLIDILPQFLGKAPLHLQSVQPYLMTAFNASRRRLDKQSGLLILVESGKASCATFGAGQLQNVTAWSLQQNTADELSALLKREMLLNNFDDQTKITLHAVENPALRIQSMGAAKVDAWALSASTGFSPISDAKFGMAMSGVV